MAKLLQWSYRALCTIMVICMACMTVMVLTNTVLRYALNTSIIVSEELSRFLFVWMIFIGGVIAMADDIHIKVDLVTRKLPPIAQKGLAVLCNLLMAALSFILMIGGYVQTAINTTNYAPATNIPLSVIYVSVILSGFGMGAVCLVRAARIIWPSDKKEETAQ